MLALRVATRLKGGSRILVTFLGGTAADTRAEDVPPVTCEPRDLLFPADTRLAGVGEARVGANGQVSGGISKRRRRGWGIP